MEKRQQLHQFCHWNVVGTWLGWCTTGNHHCKCNNRKWLEEEKGLMGDIAENPHYKQKVMCDLWQQSLAGPKYEQSKTISLVSCVCSTWNVKFMSTLFQHIKKFCSKYLFNQSSRLSCKLVSLVSCLLASSLNWGMRSRRILICHKGTTSPMTVLSLHWECFKTYIPIDGSGYKPFWVDDAWSH